MFIDSFNPKAALAAASFPRSLRLELTQIDSDAFDAAPPEHHRQATAYISPSLKARCAMCQMVSECCA
jgi:hypothetical protein